MKQRFLIFQENILLLFEDFNKESIMDVIHMRIIKQDLLVNVDKLEYIQ